MAAVALHARHGVGEALVERLAIGEAGQGVVLLEIANLRFGLAALASPHPREGGGHGNAGAEQEKRDAGDQAEIARQHLGLVALVEIDYQRAARLAVQG